ncbi:MAG: SGNH/GDSL hydrolase family protein [Oligoflexia bacterium]|nr:SGNH/GDSL hydrolase family protein [Oligoflexia bacterium]
MNHSNRKSQKKFLLATILLLMLFIFLLLIGSEFLLRKIFKESAASPPQQFVYSEIFYHNQPNASWDSINEIGEKVSLQTDSYGLRCQEDCLRNEMDQQVIVLGDSFVFGENSQYSKTFVEQINQNLKMKTLRFLNAGVNGYSNHEALILLRYLYSFLRPKAIFLVVYMGNDLRDAYFLSDKQRIILERTEEASWKQKSNGVYRYKGLLKKVRENSRIVKLIYNVFQKFRYRDKEEMSDYFLAELEFFKKKNSVKAIKAIENVEFTLKHFKNFCNSKKTLCEVVLVPAKSQVYQDLNYLNKLNFVDEQNMDSAIKFLQNKDYSFDRPSEIYASILNKLEIPFLDLTEEFRQHKEEKLYGMIDRHWFPKGEELAAKVMLKRSVVLNKMKQEDSGGQ